MKKCSVFALLSPRSRRASYLVAGLALTSLLPASKAQAASTELAKIAAPSPTQRSYFGKTLLRSGGELFVSASSGPQNTSVIYVYSGEVSPTSVPKVVSSPPAAGSTFGSSLARAGSDLFVSAPGVEKVFVFSKDPSGNWTLRQTLQESGRSFGSALAASADTLVIGAPRDASFPTDTGLAPAGRAHIYKRNASTGDWDYKETLSAGSTARNESYGASVDIRGNRILVGAYRADTLDGESGAVVLRDSGKVYSYVANASGSWVNGTKRVILAPAPSDRAQFGRRVALTAAGAIISAPQDSAGQRFAGSVYSLRNNPAVAGDLSFVQRLDPLVVPLNPELSMAGWNFGSSLALSDDGLTLAVGVSGAGFVGGSEVEDFIPSSGEVHVYSAKSTVDASWENQATVLRASDPAGLDDLGAAVALNENRDIYAGASGDDDGGTDSGSLYRFKAGPAPKPAPLMPLFGLAVLGGALMTARRRHCG